jgi:hypothetical protein
LLKYDSANISKSEKHITIFQMGGHLPLGPTARRIMEMPRPASERATTYFLSKQSRPHIYTSSKSCQFFPSTCPLCQLRSAYKAVSVVEEACQQPALLDGRVQKNIQVRKKKKEKLRREFFSLSVGGNTTEDKKELLLHYLARQ